MGVETHCHGKTYDPLTPGIHLGGSLLDTSAGVLLHNSVTGETRLTVASHGWDDQDFDVYHDNNVIGTITRRSEHRDWALVELTNDVQFTNTAYLGPPAPHNLLDCWDVTGYVTPISYFAADGFTTGTVWFNYAGLVYRKNKGYIIEMSSDFAYIFRRLRGTADELAQIPAPELCGAPVVHQETTDDLISNSVCGFVWLNNLQLSWVVAVGPLIDAGWEIVQQ